MRHGENLAALVLALGNIAALDPALDIQRYSLSRQLCSGSAVDIAVVFVFPFNFLFVTQSGRCNATLHSRQVTRLDNAIPTKIQYSSKLLMC